MAPETSSRIPDGTRIGDVELTTRGIFEHAAGVRSVFVERSMIQGCALRRGFTSERAFVGTLIAAALLVGGLWMGAGLLVHSAESRRPKAWAYLWGGAIMFSVMGYTLLRQSLNRGVYLEIRTAGGVRRFTIGKTMTEEEAVRAIRLAREAGYVCEPFRTDAAT